MRRVGKGFLGVETPLFEGMLVAGEIEEQDDTEEQLQDNVNDAAQRANTAVSEEDVVIYHVKQKAKEDSYVQRYQIGLVEEPKPMKKKQQSKWMKTKEDLYVQRYQVMKKRPQTEARARRNMIMYLKNVVGFRLDYFKGMSYDNIRPIFEAKFNSNIKFLWKTKEQLEEEENRAIESINETPAQKAANRRKLNEEVEELKQNLEIVPDEDDDVYTEATPLARKVPVVDYQIIQLNNKPRYKIIRADGTHQ
nr:hypothetical protein [Tanacetum cinerariifolium]